MSFYNSGGASTILETLREVSIAGKSQKQEAILLALGLCSRFG